MLGKTGFQREKLVSTGHLWLVPNWMISPFEIMSFIRVKVSWRQCSVSSLLADDLLFAKQGDPFSKLRRSKGDVGCDPDTRMCADERRTVFLKRRGWFSPRTRKKKAVRLQQNVCVFGQKDRSMGFVGGFVVLWKAKRMNTPRL